MIKRAMAAAIAIGLSFCGTAFGKDSGHRVCSGVATFQADGDSPRIGISIVVDDYRAGSRGSEREWLLSWVYAGRLFQGSVRETEDSPLPGSHRRGGSAIMRGRVAIRNGKNQLYVGTFSFERANAGQPEESYALVLDGRVTDDPDSVKLYPIKAMLPCIDIST